MVIWNNVKDRIFLINTDMLNAKIFWLRQMLLLVVSISMILKL